MLKNLPILDSGEKLIKIKEKLFGSNDGETIGYPFLHEQNDIHHISFCEVYLWDFFAY